MNAELIPVLIFYLLIMSTVLFVMMGVDKRRAKLHARRISERTLFFVAAAGGALGGLAGMYIFRHKTQKPAFKAGFPVLAVLNIAVGVLLLFFVK